MWGWDLPAIPIAPAATVVLLAVTVVAVVVIPFPLPLEVPPFKDPPFSPFTAPELDPLDPDVPTPPLSPAATVGNESAAAVKDVTIVDLPEVMVVITTTEDSAELDFEIGPVVEDDSALEETV